MWSAHSGRRSLSAAGDAAQRQMSAAWGQIDRGPECDLAGYGFGKSGEGAMASGTSCAGAEASAWKPLVAAGIGRFEVEDGG